MSLRAFLPGIAMMSRHAPEKNTGVMKMYEIVRDREGRLVYAMAQSPRKMLHKHDANEYE